MCKHAELHINPDGALENEMIRIIPARVDSKLLASLCQRALNVLEVCVHMEMGYYQDLQHARRISDKLDRVQEEQRKRKDGEKK